MSRSERVVSSNNVLQFRVPILNLFFRLRARVNTRALALASSDAGSAEASIANEHRRAVSRQDSNHISSVRVNWGGFRFVLLPSCEERQLRLAVQLHFAVWLGWSLTEWMIYFYTYLKIQYVY